MKQSSIKERAAVPTAMAVAWLSLCLLGGCSNLQEVRQFGAISADTTSYTRLTDDYVTAPQRNKLYSFTDQLAFRAAQDSSAARLSDQKRKLMLYHKVLTDYMSSLAGLAGSDLADYRRQVGGMTEAAARGGFLKPKEQGAVNTIAGLIAEMATDAYRRDRLADLIGRADCPLQDILADMRFVIGTNFPESLQQERAVFDNYYRSLNATAGKNEPAAAQLAAKMHDEEVLRFDARADGPPKYVATLDYIARAHAHLYANRDALDSRETTKALLSYIGKIQRARQEIVSLALASSN